MWGYADYKANYLSYPREKKVEEMAMLMAVIFTTTLLTAGAASLAWLQYEGHPHRTSQVICRSIIFFVVAFIVLVGGVV